MSGHTSGRTLLALIASAVFIGGVPGIRAQEEAPATFEDSGRVDSLRERVTPDRLESYRRRAAEEGGAETWYDLGTALLLSGDWEGAVEPLERVVMTRDDEVVPSASYNLGVARGLGGRPPGGGLAPSVGAAGTDVRREALARARDAFRRTLRADPAAEDARWNLEVVDRWLEQLGGAGGGGGDGGGGGQQGGEGEPRELTPEELQRLLDAAASEERRVQEERFERSRARDPVAERNW